MQEQLKEDELVTLAENCTYLGRRWLDTIPFNSTTTIQGRVVERGLMGRTLCPVDQPCPLCHSRMGLGHSEVCAKGAGQRTALHDNVKRVLARFLRRAQDTQVVMEPSVGLRPARDGTSLVDENGRRRTDLRVMGDASLRGDASDIDISFASGHTARASIVARMQAIAAIRAAKGPVAAAEATVQQVLEERATAKRRTYEALSAHAFLPVVLSPGGVLHPTAASCLTLWKAKIKHFDYMLQVLSVQMVVMRAGVSGALGRREV